MSNFGHCRSLGTPGGDLGFQGSIFGPKTSELFGLQIGVVFGCFWGLFSRCFLGRPLDHVFNDFGMVLGSMLGSFSLHLRHKKGACTK